MFKRRSKTDSNTLAEQLDKLQGKSGFQADPNEWTVTKDEAGNGSARIRFLPHSGDNGEICPFVKIYTHNFKIKGQWYIENCPTTHEDNCPACEANKELWDSGIDSNRKTASSRKRKTNYWANILVLNDSRNPDAVGKVFKFRFGAQIMDKIAAKNDGDKDLGIESIDVTDPWEGADFLLKFEKTQHGGTYINSAFSECSELFDGDEDKLKEAFDGMHPIQPIVAKSEFKAFDVLEKRFNKVSGSTSSTRKVEEDLNNDVDSLNQVDSTGGIDDAIFDNQQASIESDKGDSSPDLDDLEDFLNELEG